MKKSVKWVIGIAAVAGVALLGVRQYQAEIGTAMFQRAVDSRVGRDVTATLPDGLHVAL